MMDRTKQANRILCDLGLLDKLNQYGKAHIIGSVRMDLMAWNDLDIDVENEEMTLEGLHQLLDYIIHHFHPTWYEAKEEINAQGNKIWFHGFEFYFENELWNIDIWFLDKTAIEKAEVYCDTVSNRIKENKQLKNAILEIKQELIKKNLYAFDKYTGMDVYDAVLNKGVLNTEAFICLIGK